MAVRIDASRGRRPVQNVSTGPRAFADYSGVGRGVAALGQAVEQRRQEREAEAEEEQRRADTVFVSKASSAARVEYAQIYDEMAAEYDGSEPGFARAIEARLQEESAGWLKGVEGERAQRLDLQLQSVRASLTLSAFDTERSRREAHTLGGITETADGNRNAILSDSGQFWGAVDSVDDMVEAAPERLRAGLAEEIRGQYGAAYVDARVSEDPRALQEELNGGDLDDILSPAVKAQAVSASSAAIARLDREAERAADQERLYSLIALQPASEDHLASLAATGEGANGFDSSAYAQLLTPQAAASYTRREAAARSAYEAVGDFSSLTPGDMAQRVEGLRPEPGAAGFARSSEIHSLAATAMERELASRQRDPAAHVGRAAPVARAREQVLAAQQGGENAPDLAAAQSNLATALLAEQERIGVPERQRRVLTEGAAQSIVSDVEEASEPGAAMRDLLGVLDSWGEHRGRVIGELVDAGLDPSAQIVAEFGDEPAMAARMARAVTGRRDARKALDDGQARDIDEDVRRELRPFLDTFSADPRGAQASAGVVAAAEALAYDYAARGMSPREASRQAGSAFLSRYTFVDDYRVPRALADAPRRVMAPRDVGVTVSPAVQPGEIVEMVAQTQPAQRVIGQGADHAFAGLISDGGARVAGLIGQGLPVAEQSALTADAIAANGQWLTMPDESGLQLVVDMDGLASPVRDRRGREIKFSWAELETLGRARLERRPATGALDDLIADREGLTGPFARPR